ncbi:flagellar biosynthetic protein FliO [Bacillus alkalicellulosilyticus]|uniref:flagellar biosynthetic protein FliO n=1 Tax=Alkalihalobacterium alkalicellulosilyticum TaxID=1912214 RepID=UPI00099631EB|nr:flagellar biosynthetic protein FliO [Bacillus alkalicellulosilyticus]
MLLRNVLFFLIGILLLFPLQAFATTENQTVFDSYNNEDVSPTGTEVENEQVTDSSALPSENIKEQSFFWLVLKMVGALLFVIGLIYALLRFVNSRTRQFQDNTTLQSIGGLSLGPNRSLQLVKVGKRVLVVGVSDSVQLLKEIDNEDEIEQILEQKKQEQAKIDEPIAKVTKWVSDTITKTKPNQSSSLQFGELLNKQLDEVSKSQSKIHEAMKERKHD